MKEILTKYLKATYRTYVEIDYFNIFGSICEVKYYTDKEHYYSEKVNINIWEIVVFLYQESIKYSL